MTTLPHLPAPIAVHHPINEHAARAARLAALRIAAHEPVSAYNRSSVRRAPVRSESDQPIDRLGDESRARTRHYRETPELLAHVSTNLFFVQRFAQEEAPSNRPAVAHETAASAYPSLDFDDDILLPGQAVPLGWLGNPRLDILV